MAAAIFDFTTRELVSRTQLDKLEARGTVRIALREGGLDAQSVTIEQMTVVLEKLLPGQLGSRGVGDAGAVCGAIAAALAKFGANLDAATEASPEEVFRRLAGS